MTTHTVEEAAELVCPLISRDCKTIHCMMWRWAQKPNPDWKPGSSSISWPQRDMRDDPPMYIVDTSGGYCGLAGRP